MNILYAYHTDLPSSDTVSAQVVYTLQALVGLGVSVKLALPCLDKDTTWQQIQAHYQLSDQFDILNYPDAGWPQPFRYFGNALRARGMPVKNQIFYTRELGMLSVAMLMGYQCVFETYRPWGDRYPFLRPYLRRLMKRPNFLGTVVHSEYTKSRYVDMGVDPERLLLAYNGYDSRHFEPRLTRKQAREQLGLPLDRQLVVYTGRISPEKGLHEMLNLADTLPDALFVLVGSKGQGPIEQRARNMNNVRIVPWQGLHDTIPYLFAADVLMVPPCKDPLYEHGTTVLPIKLFSYLAAGRAVLAPNTPDVAEILEHGRTAVLVQPNNKTAAAQALSDLLGDGKLRDRLAAEARDCVERYTWDARAKKIQGFISQRLDAATQSVR